MEKSISENSSTECHEYYDESITSEDSLLGGEKVNRKSSLRRFISLCSTAACHTLLVLVYSSIFVYITFWSKSNDCHGMGAVFTPAREGVQYESQFFDIDPNVPTTWFGEPSPELDERWHELQKHQMVRLSEEDFAKIDRPVGLELPGGGYLAFLMVYHNIHCLQRLHHYQYPDVYYPNMSAEEVRFDKLHIRHCLNTLLRAVTCQPDLSPVTMRWGANQATPLADFATPHECINQEIFDDWIDTRSVDIFEPGFLMHPIYGPSFPDGEPGKNTKNVRIGVAVDHFLIPDPDP